MMCFHKWSKWVVEETEVAKPIKVHPQMTYTGPAVIKYTEEWQRRECEKCGKTQVEFLR